ncbi:hypothetical protein V9T40_000515 [Parthenolecanium corni]|uniref:Calcineurin-like phosphoesterase domain-containing protein n=1 Tax=Parthenolecanium corni TaxID=536013 RepID=A0AAN9TQK5_9HEMI
MPQQIYFNKAANRQRVDIEHGIGCLKNRFRQSFFLKTFVFRLLLINVFLLTLYNEYIVYILKPITTWPEIKCSFSKCIKLFVVADPQILGKINENVLTRYDSDRYLRNTFSIAFEHVKPDGILFLGDLTDEGYFADDEQFARYYERIKSIFQLKRMTNSNIPTVFIPGDNDIGGENNELIKAVVVKRFREYFGKEEVETIDAIRILKVNKLLRTYPSNEERTSEKLKFNIAISHVPLTDHLSPFSEQVVRDIKPEFIFSAHTHKSFALLTLKENGRRLYYEELKENAYKNKGASWSFQAASSTNYSIVTEIVVPTCSYRMGVADMGYSVIVYGENSAEITYYVLWLPSRFILLLLYLIFFVIWGIIFWINFSYLRLEIGLTNTGLSEQPVKTNKIPSPGKIP